jgi:putative peptide zinc metalloprotease protein
LPYSILSTLELQPRDAASVYVEKPGRLVAVHVKPGQEVRRGDLLATLVNPELDLQIAQKIADRDNLETRLVHLERVRFTNRLAADTIPEVRNALESRRNELARLEMQRQQLNLVAPCDGTVLLPPTTTRIERPDAPLPTWDRTPLDPKNLNAFLDDKVLFCQIGDPEKLEAVLVIDQDDAPFVRKGLRTDVKLDELPYKTFEGKTAENPSQENLKVASRRLSNRSQGELATKTDPKTGIEAPMSTSYQTRVPIDDTAGELLVGLRGRARVHMDRDHWQTLGQRLWRLAIRTFNFKL